MYCPQARQILPGCLLAMIVFSPAVLHSQQPLHEKIDAVIQADQFFGTGPRSSDSEFLRRVYLDLLGTSPGADEAREFLASESADKRSELVWSLVADPRVNRHLTTIFDVMWMERIGDKHVNAAEWQKYLYDSFVADKKYDQLVREILAADGTDEKIRAASRFYLAREGEVNRLTRDVGRMFLGVDLQCAQCHDHPLIDSYYQADYYGIFAFLNRSFLFTDKEKKVFYAEKAEGDVSFKSVFTEEAGETGPRLPGEPSIAEPVIKLGEEYIVKPAKEVRPVPRYSRREQLASNTASTTNRAFKNNIANRLWAQMLGQGIFNPVDLQHADNPPLNPELLDLLGDEFAAMDFDIKKFLAELALTEVYQQSYSTPADLDSAVEQARQRLAELDGQQQQLAEQLSAAQKVFGAESAQLATVREARSPFRATQVELNKALGEAMKVDGEAAKALADADAALKTKQGQLAPVASSLKNTSEALALLPGDEQIKALVALYQKRDDEFTVQLETLSKDHQAKLAVATEMAAAREVKQQAVDEGYAGLSIHDEQVAAVDIRFQKIRNDQERLKQLQARLAEQQQDAEHVIHHGEVAGERQQLELELVATTERFNVSTETAKKLTMEMPGLEKKVIETEAARAVVSGETARLGPLVAEQLKRTTALATVVEKAELVRGKIPDDQELADAADQLKEAHQGEAARLAELQRSLQAASQRLASVESESDAVQEQLTTARGELANLEQEIPVLTQQLPVVEGKLHEAEDAELAALGKTTDAWIRRFAVSTLKPLQPEQFAWSVMQSVGLVKQTRTSVMVELDKNSPMSDEDMVDSAKVKARRRQVEEQVFEKLKGNVGQFVTLFGASAGQPQDDFFSTVDQALFVANGGPIRSWLNPSGDNLAARLDNENDPNLMAEELYLSVLARRPSETEVVDVRDYLSNRGEEKTQAIQEMIWGLLASAEFRFNH
jgi:hypothetical protein